MKLSPLKTPPWTINRPIVKLELTKLSKTKTRPKAFPEKILDIQSNFSDHHHIYTNESKQGMEVGSAAILQNQKLLKHFPNESSVYSADITAINLAMNIIANHKFFKSIVYAHTKSFLLVLQNKYTSTPLIKNTLKQNEYTFQTNSIILTCIPSHVGILGNERADKAAKNHSSQINPIQKSHTLI